MVWCGYYGLKSYAKTRIDIQLLPPLPSHVTVPRTAEVDRLNNMLLSQHSLVDSLLDPVLGGEQKIRKVAIVGPPGSGKTVLARDTGQQMLDSYKAYGEYSLPKSQVLVFLQADSEQSFLFSLKGFAAKLNIRSSDLSEAMGRSFKEGTWLEQCNGLLTCIQENLKKHPDWVLVLDNVEVTTPQSVLDVVNDWFAGEEQEEKWSRGSVFVVHDGTKKDVLDVPEEFQFVNSGYVQLMARSPSPKPCPVNSSSVIIIGHFIQS